MKAEFEKLVIAQLLTGMLDKYLTGRPAPLGIGAEQGDIDEWDDVVINHTPDTIEHMQVKRQTTNFCGKNPDLSKEATNKKNVDASAPTQSVLDKAFASLARWEEKGSLDSNPNHTFKLILVGEQLEIKKELRISLLAEICMVCRQDGFQLKDLVNRTDKPTKRLHLWLTTWCGFKDWEQISKVLKRVHIYCAGNDETLKERVNETLTRHFSNPQRTFDCLLSYIISNTSDVTMLSCHELARALQSELRPDIETWAQYALRDDSSPAGKSWSVAGIHDLSSRSPGSAKSVVDHMWSNLAGNRKLRVYAPYSHPVGDNLTLPLAITRMALHLKNGAQSLMLGELTWRSSVGHEVGHTLGSAENDLRDLPWIENSEPLECLPALEFKTQSALRVEAEALAKAMDDLLWLNLVQDVSTKLGAIKDLDLANEMEKVWLAWGAGFNNNPESRRRFMEQLLYPKTENKNAQHALRLGPRTLPLLVTAVETLLLV
ncbi:MAG: ABC-three component system protein, partial [Serratia proteamaculans]